VSVSYTESRASRILRDCVLGAQSSLTGDVSEGVRRRILGDSVAESGHYSHPQADRLGFRVTVCLAGSHGSEVLSVDRLVEARISSDCREFLLALLTCRSRNWVDENSSLEFTLASEARKL